MPTDHTAMAPPAEPTAARPVRGVLYLMLALGLTIYVALVAPYRSEMLPADAWEHHAAVLALTENLTDPGNPTYATPEPSIRYSPFSVAAALVSRMTGLEPYTVLTGASVLNVALFLLAFYWFIRGFDETRIAFLAGLCLIFLYGRAPGYANSFALSDLSWHSVNPSVLSMALNFACWGLLWRASKAGAGALVGSVVLSGVLLSVSVLCHGMSGVLGAMGVAALVVAVPRPARVRQVMCVIGVGAVSLGLTLLWPWYRFLDAASGGGNVWYWFNVGVSRQMFFVWCAPAFLLALLALPHRVSPLVRFSLVLAFTALGLGIVASGVKSASLARLPLAATPLACIAVAYWMKAGGFGGWAWGRRTVAGLFGHGEGGSVNAWAVTQLLAVTALLYGAVPQLRDVVSEPHLARPLIAELAGRENKQPEHWKTYAQALAGIAPGDVVLSDLQTGWPVPSFRGRVVGANHLELFTPGQRERWDDTDTIFNPDTDPDERRRLMDRYDVRWVLLARDTPLAGQIRPSAVEAESGRLVLMDAERWVEALHTPPLRLIPPPDQKAVGDAIAG